MNKSNWELCFNYIDYKRYLKIWFLTKVGEIITLVDKDGATFMFKRISGDTRDEWGYKMGYVEDLDVIDKDR